MAVLRATARLDADDPLDLDLRTTPPHPHMMLERVRDPLIRKLEHGERLRLGQADSVLEHLRARDGEDVVGQRHEVLDFGSSG